MNGLNITTKENGLEAYNYIKNNYEKIDIIISDLKMPILDGLELAKRVKQLECYKGKFVCVSGGVDFDLEKETYLDAVLAKPYSRNEIMKIIKEFL
jgi:two-component system response regulator YesN